MKGFQHSLIAAALILIGSSPAPSEGSDEDIWAECRASNSCTIEYDRLANQDTDPFLFIGKVVDREHPRWSDYRRSLRRYPDVRDCLVKEEQTAEAPNLLKIDWHRVGTGRNASVCVFRIAASLGDVERVLRWLEFHGFRHRGLNRFQGSNFIPLYEKEPVSQITARWTIDQYREFEPSWFALITGYELIYEYRLILQFDQSNKIAGVGVNTPSKLN